MGEMSMWTRMPGQTWPGFAVSFLGMWMTMMMPMMIPPFAVMLRGYRWALDGDSTRSGAASIQVGLSYFAIWSALGVAALAIAVATSPTVMRLSAPLDWAPVISLITIAITIKSIISQTRVVASRQDPWRYGMWLGLHCAATCGPLMAIGLAFGTDLRAMTATTIVITAKTVVVRRPTPLSHSRLAQRRCRADDRHGERGMREIECQLRSGLRPQRELAVARHDHHRQPLPRRHELVVWL